MAPQFQFKSQPGYLATRLSIQWFEAAAFRFQWTHSMTWILKQKFTFAGAEQIMTWAETNQLIWFANDNLIKYKGKDVVEQVI